MTRSITLSTAVLHTEKKFQLFLRTCWVLPVQVLLELGESCEA